MTRHARTELVQSWRNHARRVTLILTEFFRTDKSSRPLVLQSVRIGNRRTCACARVDRRRQIPRNLRVCTMIPALATGSLSDTRSC